MNKTIITRSARGIAALILSVLMLTGCMTCAFAEDESLTGEPVSFEELSSEEDSSAPDQPLPTRSYILTEDGAIALIIDGAAKKFLLKQFVMDANGDSFFNAADARFVLRLSARLETTTLTTEYLDADKDGDVTATDARIYLRSSAKLDKLYEAADGQMPSGGMQDTDGKIYVFNNYGCVVGGFYENDGKRYWINDNGTAVDTIQFYGGKTYFFRSDGSLYTGLVKYKGEMYIFTNGLAKEGIVNYVGYVYYSQINGKIVTGWKAVDGSTYYFKEDGTAAVGRVQIGDYYYCFGEDGKMVFGFQTVDGVMYYFDPQSGAMLTNTTVDGHLIDENGVCTLLPVNVIGRYTSPYGFITSAVIEYPTSDEAWELICLNKQYKLNSSIDSIVQLSYVAGSSEQMDTRAAYWYNNMYDAARSAGIYLTPVSGYRSYSSQLALFNEFVNDYISSGYSGYEAERRASARRMPAGSSEHNIGICMDIITASSSANFQNTAAYRWLSANAADYGFILRYPADKESITGVQFEPWHWRFVGVKNARAIRDSGKCLEEYLGLPSAG